MTINKVKLTNFRQFNQKEVCFSNLLNILVGSNAKGKTTIIEAINCLSIVKSFRTNDLKNLIQEDKSYFYIEGTVEKQQSESKISLYMDQFRKNIKRNQYTYSKISDYLGFFDVVTFSANDFLVFKGTSAERRILFEPVFCQISKEYLNMCNYYKKLLKERNSLLKSFYLQNKHQYDELFDALDTQIIEIGTKMIQFRQKMTHNISDYAEVHHKNITTLIETLKIEYSPSTNIENYKQNMVNNFSNDLRKGYTSVGPHRDDYIFIINNKNIMEYGSQGQQKNALISLKLGMASLLAELKEENPVIMLDDVFSELDKSRQNALMKCFEEKYQVIVTTASISDLEKDVVDRANIIEIK